MRTSKKLNSKNVYIKENINLFQKSRKVFYINKIKKIDKVNIEKLNKRRFLSNIEVLLTF